MAEVGVHEFRNKIYEYVRRAEAGEEIAITRRGKGIARLRRYVERPAPPERMARK